MYDKMVHSLNVCKCMYGDCDQCCQRLAHMYLQCPGSVVNVSVLLRMLGVVFASGPVQARYKTHDH